MNIKLIDLDKRYPNLALMKLSKWHKQHGDSVELNFLLGPADMVYVSCVFPENNNQIDLLPFDNVVVGGSGTNNWGWLPSDIEHIMPDYDLYGCTYSLGFTSRGCSRHCPWCIVPQKEGHIRAWASIYEFWDRRHKKIVLLDNNLLASSVWKEVLGDLVKEKLSVDFNQGLDIRLVDDEIAHYLARVKRSAELRFSFDELAMEAKFRKGMMILQQAGINPNNIRVYVLVGFDSTLEDDIGRIDIIKELGAKAFVMRYKEVNGVKSRIERDRMELIRFSEWVNNTHGIYRKLDFSSFLTVGKGKWH